MLQRARVLPRYVHKGYATLRNDGLIAVLILSLLKVQKMRARTAKTPTAKVKITSLVRTEDVMAGTSFPIKRASARRRHQPPYTINWVMSPPRGGGGHQTLFRFIYALDKRGHRSNVYLYSSYDFLPVSEAKQNIINFKHMRNVSIKWLKGAMEPADAVIATGWETAYPVLNSRTQAKKMYFVQDFEPYFYPVGTDYVLAENTYKFGFFGVTAGGWLSNRLKADYGMTCEHFEFGADPSIYKLQNTGKRRKIYFYARPVTTRRGFELGIMALAKFHELMPEYEIVMSGWDVSEYHIPFPYTNMKVVSNPELNEIYNDCAAALVISLTNMSLMPLELLASGVIPVVNDGPNNTMVSSNTFIHYVPATPHAMAQALKESVLRNNKSQIASRAAESVKGLSWEGAYQKLEDILEEQLS